MHRDRADCLAAGDEAGADPLAFRLLNDYQRDFPLCPRPFEAIAAAVGSDEDTVLECYRRLAHEGVISRIGAVFAPRRIGASALAALSAPADRIEAVADRVSATPEVNHNYLREHGFNLWFVITAESGERLDAVVAAIERDTGCDVIVLPLEEEFHIDLGFCLAGRARDGASTGGAPLPPLASSACSLPQFERRLMSALQTGLPLEPQPFDALGRKAELSEAMTLELIRGWQEEGLIKRFGAVVRHHELGFRANAMCVWDVPDELVSALGKRLGAEAAVTLCYRRRRAAPRWPYNLFCMIHGKSREAVAAARDALAARLDLDRWPHDILFSTRRFKQRGARYLPDETRNPPHG
ncbi:MAG TPA: Lrp/AsnC family transcriptional regulator [Rhodocyclaceae bacterium]|nr:Lrp/AsnC family transcriptional regulator [Rhodocyclaceae bacterium]